MIWVPHQIIHLLKAHINPSIQPNWRTYMNINLLLMWGGIGQNICKSPPPPKFRVGGVWKILWEDLMPLFSSFRTRNMKRGGGEACKSMFRSMLRAVDYYISYVIYINICYIKFVCSLQFKAQQRLPQKVGSM